MRDGERGITVILDVQCCLVIYKLHLGEYLFFGAPMHGDCPLGFISEALPVDAYSDM